MSNFNLLKIVRVFLKCDAGNLMLQSTLLIGAGVIAIALLAAPLLDRASKRYVNNAYGVDQFLTASTVRTNRYTVRRSVLEAGQLRLCPKNDDNSC